MRRFASACQLTEEAFRVKLLTGPRIVSPCVAEGAAPKRALS
jgi:hypothetical protein